MNRYDKKHLTNLALYGRRVDEIYKEAIKRAGQLGINLRGFNPNKPFSFADYPIAKNKADKLVEWLHRGLTEVISAGVSEEWALSNEKNDEYVDKAFGASAWRLPDVVYRQYYNTNGAAENAFLARKQGGLGLSDRVWQYSERFKDEIELGLDLGIRAGRSADQISRDIRLYLQHPDKLFRRVKVEMKNEDDEPLWRLSKAAELEHPGRGVYRSSYKNARRLAVTETNMAYRAADHERWQQLDFILGQHVILSKRHSEEDGIEDMCDELSGKDENDKRGRYPKEFKFTGWHPLCRCYVVPIMLTPEEMKAKAQATINGEEYTPKSQPITDMPEEFKQWVDKNAVRIERVIERGTLPQFLSDNIVSNELGSAPGADKKGVIVLPILPKQSESDSLERLVTMATKAHIMSNPVQLLKEELSVEKIIEKLAGTDALLDGGSCVSQGLAYIGNRFSYDVTDFRGGMSRLFFAQRVNIKSLCKITGGIIAEGTDDFMMATELLKHVEEDKEYLMYVGQHMSIVRRKDDRVQYLELQRGDDCGYKQMSLEVMEYRFGCIKNRPIKESSSIVEITKIAKNDSFAKLLSFINTQK